MNDLLQLEIKAANIVGDLNSKLINQAPSDMNEILAQQKCLNYPIQEINFSKVSSFEKNLSKRKVPVYMQYCVDLVLAEIGEGDLIKKKNKYKYVKDLPLVKKYKNNHLVFLYKHESYLYFCCKAYCSYKFVVQMRVQFGQGF